MNFAASLFSMGNKPATGSSSSAPGSSTAATPSAAASQQASSSSTGAGQQQQQDHQQARQARLAQEQEQRQHKQAYVIRFCTQAIKKFVSTGMVAYEMARPGCGGAPATNLAGVSTAVVHAVSHEQLWGIFVGERQFSSARAALIALAMKSYEAERNGRRDVCRRIEEFIVNPCKWERKSSRSARSTHQRHQEGPSNYALDWFGLKDLPSADEETSALIDSTVLHLLPPSAASVQREPEQEDIEMRSDLKKKSTENGARMGGFSRQSDRARAAASAASAEPSSRGSSSTFAFTAEKEAAADDYDYGYDYDGSAAAATAAPGPEEAVRICHVLVKPADLSRDWSTVPESEQPYCLAATNEVQVVGRALDDIRTEVEESGLSLMLPVEKGNDLCACRHHLGHVVIRKILAQKDLLRAY